MSARLRTERPQGEHLEKTTQPSELLTGLLQAIDEAASMRPLTGSASLASAAQEGIEETHRGQEECPSASLGKLSAQMNFECFHLRWPES